MKTKVINKNEMMNLILGLHDLEQCLYRSSKEYGEIVLMFFDTWEEINDFFNAIPQYLTEYEGKTYPSFKRYFTDKQYKHARFFESDKYVFSMF